MTYYLKKYKRHSHGLLQYGTSVASKLFCPLSGKGSHYHGW